MSQKKNRKKAHRKEVRLDREREKNEWKKQQKNIV